MRVDEEVFAFSDKQHQETYRPLSGPYVVILKGQGERDSS